jgi:hypothetical protein
VAPALVTRAAALALRPGPHQPRHTAGIVRADVALRAYDQTDRHDTIYMTLTWDVSRTGARGGVRLTWDDETGWTYASSSRKGPGSALGAYS